MPLLFPRSKELTGSQTPFVIFVKKFQESLTRFEALYVVTVTQDMDGTSTPLSYPKFPLLTYLFPQIRNTTALLHSSLSNCVCAWSPLEGPEALTFRTL